MNNASGSDPSALLDAPASVDTAPVNTVPDATSDPAPDMNSALRELVARSREQQRKLSEARAREHVGAAGWQQTSLLEEIIRAGRSQFASTDALRQVVELTTQNLRELPLAAGQEPRDDQQRTLEGIVKSGNQQVGAAHELEEVIRQALAEVLDTPLSDLNVRKLERVLERVREQILALNLMIEVARAEAGTLEQLQALDAVSAQYQRRLGELQSLSAEDELEVLGTVGEQVVDRITELDAHGGKQLEKLGSIGEAAVKGVTETSASKDEQLHTLEGIQAEAEAEAAKLKASD